MIIARLLLGGCTALYSREGTPMLGAPNPLPNWTPTYNMSLSTIFMPCNDSGFMDAEFSSKWGIVDFDWSNGKQDWANQKPMDCQERLLTQAKMIKDRKTGTKVMVYRNLVKALPWYSDVREKITDPAFSGWFLRFKDGASGKGYHVPACTGTGKAGDPKKCSDLYHDQDQTPEHPHGDGSCRDACDCGEGLPCGEYLWDHRNESLRRWLVDEYVMGEPSGVGSALVDGVFLDDGWANASEPAASWWPKEGFCSADAHGGPTEEMANCTVDMGLGKAEVQRIYDAYRATIAAVRAAVVAGGAYNYQMLASTATPKTAAECAAYLRDACEGGGGGGGGGGGAPPSSSSWQSTSALRYELTKRTRPPVSGAEAATLARDVATFLLVRGPFAWIGHGWIGCTSGATPANETQYNRPALLDRDYGEPVDARCGETAKGSGVFTRRWTKAAVTVDCNALSSSIEGV